MKRILLPVVLALAACGGGPRPLPDPPARPSARASTAPDAESFRATRPSAEPRAAFQPDLPQEARLPNGLHVMLFERHDLPVVAVQLLVPHGSDDAAPRVGSLAMGALFRGHRDRGGASLKERFDAVPIRASSWAALDSTGVGFSCVRDAFGRAALMLAEALVHPTIEARDFEHVRSEALARFDADKTNLSTVQQWAVRDALYPIGHPYREATSDRARDIRAVTLDAANRYIASHLTPNGMTLEVAGDVTLAEVKETFERALGSWRGKPTSRPTPPAPAPVAREHVFFVPWPGAAQTHVTVTAPSIARGSPDWAALMVWSEILGGAPSSRLGKNLRESKGLTYGVSSWLTTHHGPGELYAGGAVIRDKTAVAVREILAEIERLEREPVPDAELQSVKEAMVLTLPSRFETLGGVLWMNGEVPVHGLPTDDVRRRAETLSKVTAEEVLQIGKKYFTRDRLRVVVTGDPGVVLGDLEALGWGPVVSLDPVGVGK